MNITNVKGAFFAIGTNMHINKNSPVPIYDISVITSMDELTFMGVSFSGSSNISGGTQASFIGNALSLSTFAIETNFSNFEA